MDRDPQIEEDDRPIIIEDDDQPRGAWRFRFGIGSMLFIMALLSIVFLMGHYMVNDTAEGFLPQRFMFLFFTLAAPMIVVTMLSVGRELLRHFKK